MEHHIHELNSFIPQPFKEKWDKDGENKFEVQLANRNRKIA
jgi:hypothetical protein